MKEHVDKAQASCFAAMLTDNALDDAPDYFEQCPVELMHVWDWFYELDDTRDTSMGVAPINHTEITNWSNGFGYDITPFERRALVAIDRAYRIHRNNQKE